MVSSVSILFLTFALAVGGCFAQLPSSVSIRLSDDRYGYLCYRNGSETNLVFQGTTPCRTPTCFITIYANYYSLRGSQLCMSLISSGNQQVVLKPYLFSFPCVPMYYNYTARQLKRITGTDECLIPFADVGINVPGFSPDCIPSIQTELLPC